MPQVCFWRLLASFDAIVCVDTIYATWSARAGMPVGVSVRDIETLVLAVWLRVSALRATQDFCADQVHDGRVPRGQPSLTDPRAAVAQIAKAQLDATSSTSRG
ncbi:uncharacterized protein J3D65DRAFT_384661 [Phyllosticta citribraziliensis]|uniref:Uncharacterized protein n=1 Tax=Phyllosticta citribraziliensis TaxID=989973 RepID=A0ABR1LQN4_9PEZI